jgi:hypothetical protein
LGNIGIVPPDEVRDARSCFPLDACGRGRSIK